MGLIRVKCKRCEVEIESMERDSVHEAARRLGMLLPGMSVGGK